MTEVMAPEDDLEYFGAVIGTYVSGWFICSFYASKPPIFIDMAPGTKNPQNPNANFTPNSGRIRTVWLEPVGVSGSQPVI